MYNQSTTPAASAWPRPRSRSIDGRTRRNLPARPFGASALRAVADAPTILDAIRVAPRVATDLGRPAGLVPGVSRAIVDELVAATIDDTDSVTAIAAVHALGAIHGSDASRALATLLIAPSGALSAHAAWATARRAPDATLVDPLVGALEAGGIEGMHAQATLEAWGAHAPRVIATSLRRALRMEQRGAGRHHLTETLGLIPGHDVIADLVEIALDEAEADWTRVAAIAALGDRSDVLPNHRAIAELGLRSDRVGQAARLAADDRRARSAAAPRRWSDGGGVRRNGANGIRVAQLHLGATLDPDLLRSGIGDTGGIATLLVKLGDALSATDGIDQVISIGRQPAGPFEHAMTLAAGGHHHAAVDLSPEDGMTFAAAWPARVAAERGIRRVFRATGRPDVLHLRMADPGTLAGANVADSLGIPTVFSLAPDPHALIAAREAAGELDRRSFGAEDAAMHLWYRAHLVERLAGAAGHVVLFPREHLAEQLRTLVGIDIGARPNGFTVVPEGIDAVKVREAVARRAGTSGSPTTAHHSSGAVDELVARVAALAPARHGLPIVLSVGRMHELKGMARLAEAFAAEPSLRARATLVIVGGDLDDPNPAEAAELARIDAARASEPALDGALILLGHRPNGEVSDLLAAVRHGVGTAIGANGAYACASRKEEFGLAIVEALAAGLPVVAPRAGGPATYVEDGVTGWLVDTTDRADLARGISGALDLAAVPGRGERASQVIAERYDITAMAASLAGVYGGLVPDDVALEAS